LVILSTNLCVEIGVNDLGWEAFVFFYTQSYMKLCIQSIIHSVKIQYPHS